MLLDREPVGITSMLNPDYIFYAHTMTEKNLGSRKDETIEEHTKRCLSHFKNIVRDKELESIFLNFEQFWFAGCQEMERELFRDMLLNTITFHDFGKINPLFQKNKMKNPRFAKANGNVEFGSKHALISAIFYLEYFLPKSGKFPKEVKRKLRLLTCIHAYIISRHHTGMDNFECFMIDFFLSDVYKDKLQILCEEYMELLTKEGEFIREGYGKKVKISLDDCCPKDKDESICLYTYTKLLFSLLIASDYYATSEYSDQFIAESHGTIDNMKEIMECYAKSATVQNIRKYQVRKEESKKELESMGRSTDETWWKEKDINVLRSELFIEAEEMLKQHREERLFYLEAPTGSGKSNVAFNLSFLLMNLCPELKKIWYIYPFNTLVEQNSNSMEKIFEGEKKIMEQIRIVNSVTPIGKNTKCNHENSHEKEEELTEYVKDLLDRQFFNYPITLSTHVTLFDILFGSGKGSGFSFYQMANSIVVLDEIQSYRNEIWSEIIIFLKGFARLLNMRIIIMSATLPDLDLLSIKQTKAAKLINDRERYFLHPLFKNRVELRYEFLESNNVLEDLTEAIKQYLKEGKKVLIEFLFKKSAEDFFRRMRGDNEITCGIELMTGDNNTVERSLILHEIDGIPEGVGFLFVATQVIEAGVDLNNMEIGFKDISMLDSEEQFMGRINRSCKKEGKVYFFNLDPASQIYGCDVRLEKKLTLPSVEMKEILEDKAFTKYYQRVFESILQRNHSMDSEKNMDLFFQLVGKLDFHEISNRMNLIEENTRSAPIFLAREITLQDGEILNGKEVWRAYVDLLMENKMKYAKKQVKLSLIKSQMSFFIYQITKDTPIPYNEQMGEIYYIEDGKQYFDSGKLNREKLLNPNLLLI